MARQLERIRDKIISVLPSGWALGRRGGYLDAIIEAVAGIVHTAEIDADRLTVEVDPRSADWLLTDFESVLGPDPCGRDFGDRSLGERRQLAHQRWTSTGGASRAYFIDIAAKLGVTITIEEFWPSVAGRMRAGQNLRPAGSQFVWRVSIPGLVQVRKFKAGVSTAGHSLGSFRISDIECELRRLKPAHTTLVFQYN